MKGILSMRLAKHTGKEAYPPIPNTNFGFFFIRKINEFIKASIILKTDINFSFLFNGELSIKFIFFSFFFLYI